MTHMDELKNFMWAEEPTHRPESEEQMNRSTHILNLKKCKLNQHKKKKDKIKSGFCELPTQLQYSRIEIHSLSSVAIK